MIAREPVNQHSLHLTSQPCQVEMGKQVKAEQEIGEKSINGSQLWHGKAQLPKTKEKVAENMRQELMKKYFLQWVIL